MTTPPQITLRLLQEADLPILHQWLNREHIVEWWGNERPSLDEVRAWYLPRVLAKEQVTPYIALQGGVPFAYVQSYGLGRWLVGSDPSPDNARAIRCYEKAGFRRVATVETPDGPAAYMLCKRRDFEAAGAADQASAR